MRAIAVRFSGVHCHFQEVRAVDGIDLEIRDGEFFSLLGPSGSGKTTSLRLIGGFEQPTRGSIEIFGAAMRGVPPFARAVNTVFQDYALFPHMSVAENVGYGLKVKKTKRDEIERRVDQMLELVELPDVKNRRPNQLSGGQKQRVSLARALINQPKILLLDEPLGALDSKLRQTMQMELMSIQKQVGITFVYVTHDQQEALSMSDRIAIFNRGKVEQVGTPEEIYEFPATAFVADFVGTSNTFCGPLARELAGDDAPFIVRPEKIVLTDPGTSPPPGHRAVSGRVTNVTFLGMYTRFIVNVAGTSVQVVEQNSERHDYRAGAEVQLSFHPDEARPIRG